MNTKLLRLLEICRAEAAKKIREDDGKNRDKAREIEKYWKATWLPDGFEKRYPYCLASNAWAIRSAGVSGFRRTAKVSDLVEWAKGGGDKGCRVKFIEPTEEPKPGDLIIIDTKQDGDYNHVGIVMKVPAAWGRDGATLTTFEGNTVGGVTDTNDPNGTSGGVFIRSRHYGKDRIVGFVRIDELQIDDKAEAQPATETVKPELQAAEQPAEKEKNVMAEQPAAIVVASDKAEIKRGASTKEGLILGIASVAMIAPYIVQKVPSQYAYIAILAAACIYILGRGIAKIPLTIDVSSGKTTEMIALLAAGANTLAGYVNSAITDAQAIFGAVALYASFVASRTLAKTDWVGMARRVLHR